MSAGYLATGFRDVDGVDDEAVFTACLRLLDSLPYYRETKQRSYELLELAPDSRVLDAGCGLGDDVFRMAGSVLPGGAVVGVDASRSLIARARQDPRCEGLPVDFRVADLNRLPDADGAYTQYRIDRVLQHVPDPLGVVSELARVLRPGGLMVVFDNDWGTFSVNSRDRRLARLVETLWCDAFASGWVGRYLRGYLLDAGLARIASYPSTSVITDFTTADKVYNLSATVRRAVEGGHATEGEGAAWLDELRDRSTRGHLAVSLTAHTVVGRKPDTR